MTIQKTARGLDGKFLRGSADRWVLVSASLDAIHEIDTAIGRAATKVEIAEAKVNALEAELESFYAAEREARTAADLAMLQKLDEEERKATADYETHARLTAEVLAKLLAMKDRRRKINARLFPKGLAGVTTYRGALTETAKLPGVASDGPDFWPRSPRTVYGPGK